jgi:hypothetical protein
MTDDGGWANALDGRDSAKLLMCSLDASRNREQMKRDLAPLVDILADLGKRRIAVGLKGVHATTLVTCLTHRIDEYLLPAAWPLHLDIVSPDE